MTEFKKRRVQMGLTQQELADKLGVSKRTLEGWDQGRHEPNGAVLILMKVIEDEEDLK